MTKKKDGVVLRELNPDLRAGDIGGFEQKLLEKISGQDHAIEKVTDAYQKVSAGLGAPKKPAGVFLFLGPTGTGKTYLVESFAEAITNKPDSVLRIDCAEFQEEHEVAKFMGSPPGYRGDEVPPRLSQKAIDEKPFILLDEIEKANPAVCKILLGIYDNAVVTLGNNETVDFSNTYIFMTSNIGEIEKAAEAKPGIGFGRNGATETEKETKEKATQTSIAAASKFFSPEFMNRIDEVVVFNSLKQSDITRIVDLELDKVRARVRAAPGCEEIVFDVGADAKKFLVSVGFDKKYGARALKRAIEKHVVTPLAALITTKQVSNGDQINIGLKPGAERLSFRKTACPAPALEEEARMKVRAKDRGAFAEAVL
ncbi:MAG: AAA family ATPase [Alphaproteobacteria bacterium]